jgi:hypothetical protein
VPSRPEFCSRSRTSPSVVLSSSAGGRSPSPLRGIHRVPTGGRTPESVSSARKISRAGSDMEADLVVSGARPVNNA